MRPLTKMFCLATPLGVVLLATIAPLPLPWSIGGTIAGILLFQLALVESLEPHFRKRRRYIALRKETDRLLALVRDLNAAVVDARAVGVPEGRYTTPIVAEIYRVVAVLPEVAGKTEGDPADLTLTAH